MEELALKIEHVSKEYRLGMIGGATLKAELQSKWAKWRHKDDPNLKIGQKAHDKNERFLALDDISLEIKKGERVAIIGHNGAGKSTLLKLICRVTAPTKGNIYINGRITSMLEVGTGFHGELTGKENIYLNGAILGMTKAEVMEKYDEIVDFSEVGQFIDTPVKRYSSGMHVKLGFSVASHLNSEIMIMDEVLAVGDVSFQNKCIAQMKKVAEEEGRTILYVSHNMATVKKLCDRCIVLSKGQIVFDGDIEKGTAIYLKEKLADQVYFDVSDFPRDKGCNKRHFINRFEILNAESNRFAYGDKILFRITWDSFEEGDRLLVKTIFVAQDGTALGLIIIGELEHHIGTNSADFILDTSFFVPGKYLTIFKLYDEDEEGNGGYYDQIRGINFEVVHSEKSIHLHHWFPDWGNAVIPCIEKAN